MIAAGQLAVRGRSLTVTQMIAAVAAIAVGVLVAVVPPQTVLLVAVAVAALILGIVRQDIALAALALSLPVQQLVMPGVGSSLVTVTKLVLWFVVAGWLIQKLLAHDSFKLDIISLSMGLLVLALAVSTWNAAEQGYWLGETYRWLATLVTFVIALDVYRRGGSARPLIAATAVGTILVTVMAVWQVVMRLGPPSYEVRGFVRAFGPFGHPNQLAIYYELTLPILLSIMLLRFRLGPLTRNRGVFARGWILLVSIAFAAGFAGVIMTQSRGGGLGVAAGVATVAFLSLLPSHRVVVALTAAGAGLLLVGLALGTWLVVYSQDGHIGARVQVTSANFAVQERLAHWYGAIHMAIRHPFLGVGAGNFDAAFRDATMNWRFRIGRGHAHNTYLQMLAQSGVIGLTAYLATLGSVALVTLRGLRAPAGPEYKAMAIGVAGMTVAMCVHGIFEYVHVLSLSLHLAICWAFVSAGYLAGASGRGPAKIDQTVPLAHRRTR